MNKTNKELINELEAYFITQDQKVIARTLASMMIDIHRFMNLDQLQENEFTNLIIRSKANSDSLMRFAEFGAEGIFKCTNLESKDVV